MKRNININMEFTAKQIAEFVHGCVEGDDNTTVNTFAKIEEGKKEQFRSWQTPNILTICILQILVSFWLIMI